MITLVPVQRLVHNILTEHIMIETLPDPHAQMLGGGIKRASAFNPARALGIKIKEGKQDVAPPPIEAEPPPPPIKDVLHLVFSCPAARLDCLGGVPLSCSATFEWQQLENTVEQICLKPVKYFLELQQVRPAYLVREHCTGTASNVF